ncbi:uncharacterized protein C4orf19 homolog [Amia ocellicauda]|uniref:uncharacterized protein C4orf19 homolog n=1 Tax=Amia ocellicauda TaxID=2972642 RepID=UPI00346496B5
MGCRCCRMIKSYIYDPSVPVDVHGRRRDVHNSLHRRKPPESDNHRKAQTFNNPDHSNKRAVTGKPGVGNLEDENNQKNRVHVFSIDQPRGLGDGKCHVRSSAGDDKLYILETERAQENCGSPNNREPSHCSSYALDISALDTYIVQPSQNHHFEDLLIQNEPAALRTISPAAANGNLQDTLQPPVCNQQPEANSPLPDTPDVSGNCSSDDDVIDAKSDTSDSSEEVNSSTASLSSADTKVSWTKMNGRVPDASIAAHTDSEEEETFPDGCDSITDSEVAEALAALEAATAGEDYE